MRKDMKPFSPNIFKMVDSIWPPEYQKTNLIIRLKLIVINNETAEKHPSIIILNMHFILFTF